MSSLSGKTVLVTGANSGIGLEACVVFAQKGARVVMVARDAQKGERAVTEVKQRSGASDVSLMLCDFSSQKDIHRFAAAFLAEHDRLHVLVNNAGAVSDVRRVTVDGLEQTFAVNHLGYFLLTSLLLDRIKASAPARIVNVASIGHKKGTLDWDNLQFERGGYQIMRAYTRSKLANVIFTRDLAKRLAGTGVTVNALHPGVVATNIWDRAPWFARPFLALYKLTMITPEEGGARIVYLATSDEVEGKTGGYYEKDRLVSPAPLAADDGNATRLWSVSEALTAKAG
jgi:NAD(P)-dependent dehydrogenase (short-subunit alcohol dehydrogenase family)